MIQSDSTTTSYIIGGFDSNKYFQLQKEKVLERLDQLRNGKLYLNIGNNFFDDEHSERTLPGFEVNTKPKIFHSLKSLTELLLCINSADIISKSVGNPSEKNLSELVLDRCKDLTSNIGIKPKIILTMCDKKNNRSLDSFASILNQDGYEVFRRYKIRDYPNNLDRVFSSAGFGNDEKIETSKKLILIAGFGENSGKLSTSLSSIYNDHINGVSSGYSKFDLFPIWSLPISHPLNLAYEASILDKGEFNVIDTYHEEEYSKRSVCSSKDIENFKLIKELSSNILGESSPMSQFRSPTDLTINFAGSAITNDHVVCIAGLHEIRRKARFYKEIISQGHGERSWIKKMDSLENQAIKYIRDKGYNPEMKIT